MKNHGQSTHSDSKWGGIALCALPFLFCPEPLLAKEIVQPRHQTPQTTGESNYAQTAKPVMQSGRAQDQRITQLIREELQSEAELSPVAKDVRILTLRGIVTLRGTVASEDERRAVEAIAKDVSGTRAVKSQLRVAAGP